MYSKSNVKLTNFVRLSNSTKRESAEKLKAIGLFKELLSGITLNGQYWKIMHKHWCLLCMDVCLCIFQVLEYTASKRKHLSCCIPIAPQVRLYFHLSSSTTTVYTIRCQTCSWSALLLVGFCRSPLNNNVEFDSFRMTTWNKNRKINGKSIACSQIEEITIRRDEMFSEKNE